MRVRVPPFAQNEIGRLRRVGERGVESLVELPALATPELSRRRPRLKGVELLPASALARITPRFGAARSRTAGAHNCRRSGATIGTLVPHSVREARRGAPQVTVLDVRSTFSAAFPLGRAYLFVVGRLRRATPCFGECVRRRASATTADLEVTVCDLKRWTVVDLYRAGIHRRSSTSASDNRLSPATRSLSRP